MEHFRFQFAKKHIQCPYCRANGKFKPYIDSITEEPLPDKYGKCERVHSCGKWVKPWEDGYTKEWVKQRVHKQPGFCFKSKPQQEFIPHEIMLETLTSTRYNQNIFIQNLLERVPYPFDIPEIEKVVSLYRIGTVISGYMTGATTFPFIDINDNVCAIQVKRFDQANHTLGSPIPINKLIQRYYKKCKETPPAWLDSYSKQGKIFTCNFGEHILRRYPNNPIGLVESPKTAIYATLYFGFPDDPNAKIWIAPGSRDWFNYERVRVLQGREIYVYPDLSKDGSTFQTWRVKSWNFEKQMPGTYFQVDKLLEKNASYADRLAGKDIADILINLNPIKFRESFTEKSNINPPPEESSIKETTGSTTYDFSDLGWDLVHEPVNIPNQDLNHCCNQSIIKSNSWSKDIEEIDIFFASLPSIDIAFYVDPLIKGSSIRRFLIANLETARAQNGIPTYKPYLDRVVHLMKHLQNMQQNNHNN